MFIFFGKLHKETHSLTDKGCGRSEHTHKLGTHLCAVSFMWTSRSEEKQAGNSRCLLHCCTAPRTVGAEGGVTWQGPYSWF
eukprot:1300335-Rhodomonas_salina.2